MIDGQTQLVGLIGFPTRHSLSPAMHNAAFRALKLNWSYVPLPVQPGRIKDAILGLSALGFRGANVTIPYKQAVIPFLHELSPESRKIGAVNTIIVEKSGSLVGHNTDPFGFITSLHEAGFDSQGKQAIVIGAGGAARAVVHALLRVETKRITVFNRDPDRAGDLVAAFADERLHNAELNPDVIIKEARDAHLLVNTTPVGMWPDVDNSIWPDNVPIPRHLTVFDLVYNPVETRLLQQAREGGAQAVSGIEMLIHQGAAAFELWTGSKAPIATMRGALKEEVT